MGRAYHKSRLNLSPKVPIRAPKPGFSRATNPISQQTLDFDLQVANFREDKNAKQVAALAALDSGLIKFLLYGGAMGGGKSYFLRWVAVRILVKLFQEKRFRDVAVMLACEDYPALKDRQLVKIAAEFPAWMGTSYADHKDFGRCYILNPGYGGGIVCFRNLDDPSKYMSAEFAAIIIDELTKNPYQTLLDLKTRLRWVGLTDIECPFIGGTNPGGIGHGWVKQLWLDKKFPVEWRHPIDYSSQFAFIRSKAEDNPYLDKSYWDGLNALPTMMRKAYREGNWDIFVGQAFPEVTRESHEYQPATPGPPKGTWMGMAFDWGFGAPFSLGWYHTDADGRLYRFHEWYGCTGTPGIGLHLPDSEIAKGIIQREKAWGIHEEMQESIRVLSPDCFQKKPNYKGGGQGPSTAEEFRNAGLKGLHPGDPDRKLKIRQFRERIKVPEPDNGHVAMPMLLIAHECDDFFRTIPTLVNDKVNVEDVDCFVAGTMIETPKGSTSIENIKKGDYVLSPIGPRRVLKAGVAGYSSTIKIEFSNGKELEATGDHKIFIKNVGLLPLCMISSGDQVITEEETCITFQKLFTKELCSKSIPIGDISNAILTVGKSLEQPFYTARYGKISTDQFLKNVISIIKTTTQPTMILKIWNWFLRLLTHDNTIKSELKRVGISKRLLMIGEQASRENKFFERTLKNAMQILPSENLRALIVANLLKHGMEQSAFVPVNARKKEAVRRKYAPFADKHFSLNLTAQKKSGLVVTNVVGNSAKRPVYYLTIDQAHLFYANKILTANTDGEDHVYDEVTLMCMARPMATPIVLEVKPVRPPASASEVASLELKEIWGDVQSQNEAEFPW